jgi:hypothetical protein
MTKYLYVNLKVLTLLILFITNVEVDAQIFKLKSNPQITTVNFDNYNTLTEQNKWQRVDDNSLVPPIAADFTNPQVLFVIDHTLNMVQIMVTCNEHLVTAGLVLEPFNKSIYFSSINGVNFNSFDVGGNGTGETIAYFQGNSSFNNLSISDKAEMILNTNSATISVNNALLQRGTIEFSHGKIALTNNATYTFAGGTIRFTHGDEDPDECIAGAPGTSFTVSDMATVKNIYTLRINGIENGPGNHFQFDNVADITLPDMTFRGRYFYVNTWDADKTTGSLIPGNVELLSTSGMNENGTLTLSKDINTDSLALGGSIILGNQNLTVKKTSIGNIWPFGQGQAANYLGRKVVTNGTGKMSFLPFTGQAIFPVAHTTNLGSNYMPIRINNTAGPAEGFSVRAADNVQFAYNPNLFKTNTSTWLIDEETPGGNTAVLSFQWDKSASEIGFVLNDAQAAHFDGNNVNLVTGTPNNPDNICETFVTAPVTQFSPWSIFSPFVPLPVSLINFNATLINKKIALNWSTATETNNDRFEIERSVDGINFNKIGQVKGKGNSMLITDYNYDDDVKGINGSIFYRLKQIDLDEKFAYSPIKSVTITAEKILVNIGPNPFIDQIKINVNANKAGKMVIRLLNNNGQAVITAKYATKQGVNELKLNSLSNLPKGLYTLELTDVEGNNSKIYKLIK